MDMSINAYEPPVRALLFVCLMGMLGLPLANMLVARPILSPALRTRVSIQVLKLQRYSGLGLAVASLGLFAAQLAPLGIDLTLVDEWRAIFESALFGQIALLRVGLALLYVLIIVFVRHERIRLALALALALIGAATVTRTSHSYAMEAGVQALLADFVHVLSGALWAGGLVVLVLCGDALGEHADAIEPMRRLITRFSPLAMAAVALVTGSGMLLTGVHVLEPETLRSTDYGSLLIFKVALVAVALVFAAMHRFVTLRTMRYALNLQRFKHTLWIETLIVLGVFYAAAMLSAAAMPGIPHEGPVGGPSRFAGLTFRSWLDLGVLAVAAASLLAFALTARKRATHT